jgi:hypothetical protein
MALTIWALIKSAHFSKGRARAWIYGDDIIVASKDATNVCDLLESVSLAVNRQKSFAGPTPFRESCGKEYWDGSDTTPIYCRYNPTDDDTATASLCSFANNLSQSRGITAGYDIVELVHRFTRAPIVGVPETSRQSWDISSDAYLLPDSGAMFRTDKKYADGNQPVPHLLFGCYAQCQRNTLRWKYAECPVKGHNYSKKLYRIRRPSPVDMKIQPESWGYVLRSSLIGGDLGFTGAVALAKRVKYKYGWVALDW